MNKNRLDFFEKILIPILERYNSFTNLDAIEFYKMVCLHDISEELSSIRIELHNIDHSIAEKETGVTNLYKLEQSIDGIHYELRQIALEITSG